MHIKICGVIDADNARQCASAGADFIGLNFYDPSPRSVSVDRAREIARALRELPGNPVQVIGVFVDKKASEIAAIFRTVGLDAIQLAGNADTSTLGALQGRGYCTLRARDSAALRKAIARIHPLIPHDPTIPGALLDAHDEHLLGGTGRTVAKDLARTASGAIPRLMLAGGLTPENLKDRVSGVHPWAVDTASGVEGDTPGIKNIARVRAFICSARDAKEAKIHDNR